MQIYGSKSVCLFAPEASAALYPCHPPQANTSSIAFNKLDTSFQIEQRDSWSGIDLMLPKGNTPPFIDEFSHTLLTSISPQHCCYAELEKGLLVMHYICSMLAMLYTPQVAWP